MKNSVTIEAERGEPGYAQLESLKRTVSFFLSEELIAGVTECQLSRVVEDLFLDSNSGLIQVKATQKVIGEKIADVEFPDGPLEALKLFLLPKALLKRWPVRCRRFQFMRVYTGMCAFPDRPNVIAVIDRGAEHP